MRPGTADASQRSAATTTRGYRPKLPTATQRRSQRKVEVQMQAFKKILVPVDFSPHSSFAVRQGADLARRSSAALVLLHVLDPLPYALPAYGEVFSPEQRAQLAVEIQRSLAALRLRAQTAGAPSVESAVREGHPPLEIVRFAEAGGFDLIVMGTHGRRGLAHAVL